MSILREGRVQPQAAVARSGLVLEKVTGSVGESPGGRQPGEEEEQLRAVSGRCRGRILEGRGTMLAAQSSTRAGAEGLRWDTLSAVQQGWCRVPLGAGVRLGVGQQCQAGWRDYHMERLEKSIRKSPSELEERAGQGLGTSRFSVTGECLSPLGHGGHCSRGRVNKGGQ